MKKSIKNVAIVLPFLTLGGAETQAFNIAIGYKNSGVNVKFFAFEEKNGLLKAKLDEAGISFELLDYDLNLIHQGGFQKLLGLRKVIKALRRFKPDYILPFTYYPNIITSAIWKLTGANACFWNQRGMERIPINAIEKLAMKMKPKYLSNSQAGAKFIANRHVFSEKQVNVINNGIVANQPKKTEDQWRKELNISSEDVCYVMVANLYPEKNHEYLLEAWSKFCKFNATLPLKLILVGYSSQEIGLLRVKAKVYDLNLKNVIFLKSTNDISGLLQICSVGILTSESEGCPNAVLEYMYWKKPAVVSNIPATQQVFGSDYPLFCELNNTESLVKALEKTLDKSFSERISLENKAKVESEYTIENLTQNYLKLLS